MRIGFVTGLSDAKLTQKLAPLQALPQVEEILLFRRTPLPGDKLRWQPLPPWHPWLGDPWRLAQVLRQAPRCDLLVGCHQKYHGVYAALAGRLWRVPVVQLLITSVDWAWPHPLFRWAIGGAQAVGVRGSRSQQLLQQRFAEYYPRRPLPLLFTPPNVFNPAPPAAASSAPEWDVLFVGSFTEDKNLPTLVATLTRVKQQRPNLRACLVGSGPLQPMLTRRLAEAGLTGSVTLAGQQPHAALDHYYARARLLFLPSVNEGLPMVIPEAQRWGLPVVAADVGEVGDLVQTDDNGCLAHPHDQTTFANAILRLLDDPAHWTRLAAGASATYRQFAANSTLAAAIPPWQTVLATLTGQKKP